MAVPARGFGDPVLDAQRVFRAAMRAMSHPGSIEPIVAEIDAPASLARGAAALLLALCDFETPLWLEPARAAGREIVDFVKFHTGAPLVDDPEKAAFALLARGSAAPRLSRFSQGTIDFPDRSTTLLIEVAELRADMGWRLRGPGIAGEARLKAEPLPDGFVEALRANRSLYPRGLDLFFVAGDRIAALARTTLVEV